MSAIVHTSHHGRQVLHYAEQPVPAAPTVRPTHALIDLTAIRHNLNFIRDHVGPMVGIMAVVKADAYGHGTVPIAKAALEWGVQGIAVATVDEALELRETEGFETIPILLAGPSFPGDAELLQKAEVSVTIGTIDLLRQHLLTARRLGCPARLHIKMDTGMGRYGFAPDDLSFLEFFRYSRESFEGLMTHFSVSDSLDADDVEYTINQRQRFENALLRVRGAGFEPIVHAANSGAVLHHPETHYQLVRPGVLMYGAHPDANAGGMLPLQPAMSLVSRIVAIHGHDKGSAIGYGRRFTMNRDGRIGIVPIGYGDGLPRAYSDGGHVLVHGRRAAITGRICMDQTMIDLTDFPNAKIGDEVVIYGRQGSQEITLEEVARIARTIPYEITCQLGGRVPRTIVA